MHCILVEQLYPYRGTLLKIFRLGLQSRLEDKSLVRF